MPRLWSETIEEHRRSVGEAILDAAAGLVAENGLTSVTMSAIAERTGIGRATLYKYFPDVEAILVAWHERQIARHLNELTAARDRSGNARARLEAVLNTYARIQHQHRGDDAFSALHHGDHVARTHQHLRDFVRDLIAAGAEAGDIRRDTNPDELASYCLHALAAASCVTSEAAVRRLVAVTLHGLSR